MICPGSNGGKNWPAGAYSPLTNAMYMPLQNMCMTATTTTDKRDPSKVYGLDHAGADRAGHRQGRHGLGHLGGDRTHDAWKYEQRAGMLSLVATGGGLVFGGDANGRFRALDDKTGKVLWEVNLGSPVSGYPITFGIAGKQYVAVTTGPSLVAGSAGRVVPELKPGSNSGVYVFALP